MDIYILCDESWLSGPLTPEPLTNFRLNINDDHVEMSTAMDAATVEEAISMDLKKELRFSNHGDKFIEFFVSRKLTDARFQTVQWLIKTRNRLNLSFETVFSAASCFDRLTSLSIASKFTEVCSPSLEDFQMEGLTHMFHHKTVLEMELIVLRALEWLVNSVTSFSFSQILVTKIGIGEGDMMNRITDHLLDDLCDLKMLAYAPSVVAVVAVLNVLEEKAALEELLEHLGKIMNLFGQEHKENIAKCVDVMKTRTVEKGWRREGGEVKRLASMLK